MGNVWIHFQLSHLGDKGRVLASSGQRAEILLNILQCAGYSPKIQNYPDQNVNSAETDKPGFTVNFPCSNYCVVSVS